MPTYLDANWLATILETVISILIFFIGVPFAYTLLIPEEIRPLYIAIFKVPHVKKIRNVSFFAFLFILVFANHLIRDIIIDRITDQKIQDGLLLGFNTLSLVLFIIYVAVTISYIKKIIYKEGGYIKFLLAHLKDKVSIKNELNRESIHHLPTICNATKNHDERNEFTDYLQWAVCNFKAKNGYNGDSLELFLDTIVLQTTIANPNFHNKKDLSKIQDICTEIITTHHYSIREIDLRSATKCTVAIAAIALKHEMMELFDYCLSIISGIPNSAESVQQICLLSIKNGNSTHAAAEVNRCLVRITENKKGTIEWKRHLNNAIILFAWLNSTDNTQTKNFVHEKLTPPTADGLITFADAEKVRKSLYTSYDFTSAEKVQNLIDDFFTKPTPDIVES